MNWRFTIVDRNGIHHEIDEPVGWDSNLAEIIRDPETHGVVFTTQGDTFEFDGEARRLLKAEYDQYGVQGNMMLILEEDCGNGYEEFSRAAFMFKSYDHICGDECYVKIALETTTEVKTIKARFNQKVNLDSSIAFDTTTELPIYRALPFLMDLPSKGILLQDNSAKDLATVEELSNRLSIQTGSPYAYSWGTIELALDDKNSELGNYGFTSFTTVVSDMFDHSVNPDAVALPPAPTGQSTQQLWNGSNWQVNIGTTPMSERWVSLGDISPILNYQELTNNYDVDITPGVMEYLLEGEIEPLNTTLLAGVNLYFVKKYKDTNDNNKLKYQFIDIKELYDQSGDSLGVAKTFSKVRFSLYYSNTSFKLNKDDELFLFIGGYWNSPNSEIIAGTNTFKMTIDNTSFFSFKTLSHTASTQSKVYAVNEVISHIAESISNGKLRAYSEYFGRTDSEPYATTEDGCGAMAVLTDGLRIRRAESKITGSDNIFALSLQDAWEGLNPIHNLGMGIEADPNRSGYNCLRMEPWKYFYKDNVILSCTNINKIERRCNEKNIFSTFSAGYQKWEAEQYNGLDEFLTKRDYRTALDQLKNDFVKLSKFVASGYALEVTRRLGNSDSKDWRYDKDTFIITIARSRVIDEGVLSGTHNTIRFDSVINYIEFYTTYPLTEPIRVGDIITVPNSTLNTSAYTVTSVAEDGTRLTGSGYQIYIIVSGVLNDEFVANGHYVITRNGICPELGVTGPVNIVDPSTVYNFRISPLHNAMRWINRIFESYKTYGPDNILYFTDGTGNYFASGDLINSICHYFNSSIMENSDINNALFADNDNAKPFRAAESVIYDYPITSKEYKLLESNPYDLIHFSNDCDEGVGWIDTIKYKPEEGLATFTLIPKVD